LSKSNNLTNLGLSSEEVLATRLPYFFHHSPSLSQILSFESLLLLSAISHTNTGDLVGELGHLVGALGHPIGQLVLACFEADLWKKHLER